MAHLAELARHVYAAAAADNVAKLLPWLPAILTTVGWGITVTVSLLVQRRQFRHGVLDAARKDLVKALRREQRWAGDVATALRALKFCGVMEQLGTQVNWTEERQKLSAVVHDNRESLLMVFEEYENPFPETTVCRGELSKSAFRIIFAAVEISNRVGKPETRGEALAQIEGLGTECQELSMFIEDVRVHIQNRVLAEIMGYAVAPRLGPNKRRRRIALDHTGKLRIHDQAGRPVMQGAVNPTATP